MEKGKWYERIPDILASKTSIWIYIFLFFYLVVFAGLCILIPALNFLQPSNDVQLILGNYTNVLSALGAGIASAAGVAAHRSARAAHESNSRLEKKIEELHEKLDRLEEKKGQKEG